MYWIRPLLSFTIILIFFSGCSHRITRKPYFQKHNNQHQVNRFDPDEADKSHKVKTDDEGWKTGNQPTDNIDDEISSATKKHPTMRSYEVNGREYQPSVVEVGSVFKGIASWYGPDFNGKKTSNGEIYDMYAFTAAHKTFPMHTIVRVTNLDNLKQVIVRVNDRGPFVKDRIIDLSKAAARTISMTDKGTARVRLEILGFQSQADKSEIVKKEDDTTDYNARELSNFYVQMGSFKNFEGAQKYREKYNQIDELNHPSIIKEAQRDGEPLYRVVLTGFRSDEEARSFIADHSGFENAFILRD